MQFLTDFRKVNERLVRKPFPLPKISTVLLLLEGVADRDWGIASAMAMVVAIGKSCFRIFYFNKL